MTTKMLKGFENWIEIEKCESETGEMRISYLVGGYYVTVDEAGYLPGGLSFIIRPADLNHYSPDIYVNARFNEKVQSISIQTTSWGALSVSEIDTVIDAYKEAQKVAREIERAFPQCFKDEN